MSSVRAKICGLTKPADITAVAKAGAAYAGFVFFAKSPRNLPLDAAASLTRMVPPGLCKVALTVDADDAALDAIVEAAAIDMLQLQGKESPARVSAVKARYGLPVMKAVGIGAAEDVARLDDFVAVADQILVDTKSPKGAALPGGNGVAFDWGLIAGRRWPLPWMLAGGLTPETVSAAVAQTGARQVDVSSAVERAPGDKDPAKIQAFCAAVAALA